MKTLARLLAVSALCLFVVLPLSAAPKGKTGSATFNGAADLTCLIECSDGDRHWQDVDTRGGCLDACESYCMEQCYLV